MSLAFRKKEKKYYSYAWETDRKPGKILFVSGLKLVFISFLVSGLLSFALSICFRASMTSDAFACSQLQKKIKAEIVEGERLKKKAALLSSPQRIEKIALTKIKMVKPDEIHFLQLNTQSPVSYSFKKPRPKIKPAGWLDDLIDRLVLMRADKGLAYGSQ